MTSTTPIPATKAFKMYKGGLASNPVGAHVTMMWRGRRLIGEVKAFHRQVTGFTTLTVRHFNGVLWPIEPCWTVVQVLPRR